MVTPPSRVGSADHSQWVTNAAASLLFSLLKTYVNVNTKDLGSVFPE